MKAENQQKQSIRERKKTRRKKKKRGKMIIRRHPVHHFGVFYNRGGKKIPRTALGRHPQKSAVRRGGIGLAWGGGAGEVHAGVPCVWEGLVQGGRRE